eukprot:4686317-Prymnesium_polylepis.1
MYYGWSYSRRFVVRTSVPMRRVSASVTRARHRGETLVEAHERLDLVPHPRILPDGSHVANESERCAAGLYALEAIYSAGAPADCGEEDEQQHHTHQDSSSGRHVAAI